MCHGGAMWQRDAGLNSFAAEDRLEAVSDLVDVEVRLGVLAGGLAALAFWGFIAACVVGGIWYAIREKQAQHETLRRIVDSGRDINADVIDRIMNAGGDPARDLKVAGYITLSIAPGLLILGWFLQGATETDQIFTIMLGVAGLVLCISVGLLVASTVMERSGKPHDNTPVL